jgi:hypothetical protein
MQHRVRSCKRRRQACGLAMRVATCMKSTIERMFICMIIPCADVTNRLPRIERQYWKDETDFRNVKFRISVYQNLTCSLPESDLRFTRIWLAVYQNPTCRLPESDLPYNRISDGEYDFLLRLSAVLQMQERSLGRPWRDFGISQWQSIFREWRDVIIGRFWLPSTHSSKIRQHVLWICSHMW